MKQIEQEIESLEGEIAQKDALLAEGGVQDIRFYDEYKLLKQQLERKMEEWEEAVIQAESE